MIPRPPTSTLFPYTTLFRSSTSLRSGIGTGRVCSFSTSGPPNLSIAAARMVGGIVDIAKRSEEHTSELQSRRDLVCRLLLEKKKNKTNKNYILKKTTYNMIY